MEKFIKRVRGNMIINAILTILMGVLFILNPKGSSTVICCIVAVLVCLAGLFDIIRYLTIRDSGFVIREGLVYGIIKLLLGVFIFTHSEAMLDIFAYLFGVFMVLMGVADIEHAIPMLKNKIWIGILSIFIAALLIAGGVVVLFTPLVLVDVVMTCIGIGVVVCGVLELVMFIVLRKKAQAVSQAVSDMEAIDVEAK